MSCNNQRESIWSIDEKDLALYSRLFPVYWVIGILFYILFIAELDTGWDNIVWQIVLNIGLVGVSSAVLAMMCIAGKRSIMPLFDWATREKTRAAAYAEGHAEGYAEAHNLYMTSIREWNQRRLNAKERGEDFDEPPPFLDGRNGNRSDT